MPQPTTTTNPRGPVDLPDPPARPIRPPPRNVSRPAPAPRLAPEEQIDGSVEVEIADERAQPPAAPATNGTAPLAAKKRPAITISTTVQHRGRTFTISASDIKLDAFCDLLDEAGYSAPVDAAERAREAPTCQYHGPMKESTARPGTYYCPKKMGNGEYCKERG